MNSDISREEVRDELKQDNQTRARKIAATASSSSSSSSSSLSSPTMLLPSQEKESLSTFSLVHKTGDLFSSNLPLVHCVSQDLRMGKGIAVEFRRRFGRIQELQAQTPLVGKTVVLSVLPPTRAVFYLITKQHYWDLPSYKTLKDALVSLKAKCKKQDIQELAMPRIGCGLDKLQWSQVESLLVEVFSDTNMTIHVYSLA